MTRDYTEYIETYPQALRNDLLGVLVAHDLHSSVPQIVEIEELKMDLLNWFERWRNIQFEKELPEGEQE